ncbi:dihydropteroate synthase [Pseudonocardia xinjiangensis]|uniref:dihydropteroate synthase n=1 Tax=Pseudonocardia xinjiangensis TaxID=75289 RepID=UPI003D8CA5E7
MTVAARRRAAATPLLTATGRCQVMGIVNVTPDSFSDGGACLEADRAIEHGLRLAADGADLVDVGGESTRPGARRVPVEVELGRVLPVVRGLAAAGVVVSIDTMRARVAEAAAAAGATVVNDVSGGLADPAMARCVAHLGTPYVVMHWRAHSERMHAHARYGDVVADVVAELALRLDRLTAAGVNLDRIVVDPGIGFAKTAAQSWHLLRRLEELAALGRPILVGASRKSLLAEVVTSGTGGTPSERDAATAAVSAIVAMRGASCVRVHDVAASAVAVRTAAAMAPTSRDRQGEPG